MVAVNPRFEVWLSHETDIDAPSLGTGTLERTMLDHTRATPAIRGTCGTVSATMLDAYWLRLSTAPDERQTLIEALVMSETRLLRDREAFVTSARMVDEKLAREPMHVLHILNASCSVGEGLYSTAATLLGTGIDPARLTIDTIDISVRATERARHAVCGRDASRDYPLTFRDQHFADANGNWQLSNTMCRLVHFARGNLSNTLPNDTRYDFIFCRNVLIYFHRGTQDRAVHRFDS